MELIDPLVKYIRDLDVALLLRQLSKAFYESVKRNHYGLLIINNEKGYRQVSCLNAQYYIKFAMSQQMLKDIDKSRITTMFTQKDIIDYREFTNLRTLSIERTCIPEVDLPPSLETLHLSLCAYIYDTSKLINLKRLTLTCSNLYDTKGLVNISVLAVYNSYIDPKIDVSNMVRLKSLCVMDYDSTNLISRFPNIEGLYIGFSNPSEVLKGMKPEKLNISMDELHNIDFGKYGIDINRWPYKYIKTLKKLKKCILHYNAFVEAVIVLTINFKRK